MRWHLRKCLIVFGQRNNVRKEQSDYLTLLRMRKFEVSFYDKDNLVWRKTLDTNSELEAVRERKRLEREGKIAIIDYEEES